MGWVKGNLIRLEEVAFGSREYDEVLGLRFLELREPLGMEWSEGDLRWEEKERHFGVYEEGLVGALAVRELGDGEVKLRQVATARDFQGMGYGRQLMELVEARMAGEGVRECELNSRMEVVGFYEKLGYEQEGEVFEEIGIPHVKMRKVISRLWVSLIPRETAVMPRMIERVIWRRVWVVRPVVQREWVSLAKVEKVVKPPRKPVARRGKTQGGVVLLVKYPKRQPMRKQPRRLQERMPRGKRWREVFEARVSMPEERPKRAREPRPPPRKTRRAFMRIGRGWRGGI